MAIALCNRLSPVIASEHIRYAQCKLRQRSNRIYGIASSPAAPGNDNDKLCVLLSKAFLISSLLILALCGRGAFAQDKPAQPQEQFAGEFLGIGVPVENYYFVKSVVLVFGNRWGKHPQTPKEIEDVVWEQLLLSYESFRRGINIETAQVEVEVDKIVQGEKAPFDWRQDRAAYEKWVKEKTNEPVELFENQIRHLLQLESLRASVRAGIQPKVTKKEAYQEYYNEHNNLGLELVEFKKAKEAWAFYRRMAADRDAWNAEKKKHPKNFKFIGTVALEFLINIWQIPKGAVHNMMQAKAGTIYKPQHIYEGWGVFKVLDKKIAKPAGFTKVKESYMAQVKENKRYAAFEKWLADLKKQAKIKVYKKEVPGQANQKGEVQK